MNRSLPPCVVHLDLDGYTDICRVHGWQSQGYRDPISETGLPNALEFFATHQICATLFAIAQDLTNPAKTENLLEAIKAGHEIGSHSITHRRLTQLSFAEKRTEIAESKTMLEQALGAQVRGFRAPEFAIDEQSLHLVESSGYAFDSSLFANTKLAANFPAVVRSGKLMELSLPSYAPLPLPFHPSYSLVLGNWYFKTGLRLASRSGSPLVLLFHLTDFAEPVPDQKLPKWKAGIYSLSFLSRAEKLRRCAAMIELVQRRYRIVSTTELLQSHVSRVEEAVKAGNRA